MKEKAVGGRRRPVSRQFCLGVLALICSLPSAAQELRDPFEIDLRPIVPGVWLAMRPRPERQPVMGNGVLIETGFGPARRLLAIDAAGSPLLAERVIAAIDQQVGLPVEKLVVSSWRGEHHLGTFRFRERWPDLEIIAQRFTKEAMLGRPMDYLDRQRETLGPQIEALRNVAITGRGPDGQAVPSYLRADYFDLVEYGDLLLLDLEESRVTEPDRLIDDRLVLPGAGDPSAPAEAQRIELIHPGPGRTGGDLIAWLPEQRILVTGDLVAAPIPFADHSHPRSWSASLRWLRDLQPALIIPGHGPPLRDTTYLDLLIEVLDRIVAEAEAAVTAGVTLEEFRAGFDWQAAPYRFTGNHPGLLLRFRQWFQDPVLEAAHNEARGVDNEVLR